MAAPAASAVPAVEDLRPLDPQEHGLIEKLNDERQLLVGPDGRPLARLSVSAALTQAASDFAEYLRATDQLSHYADGRTPGDRALEAGFAPPPGPGLSVAENLFEGDSAEAAYLAWKSSPSHAAVLFHPDTYWVGVGRSANKWVLLAGGRCGHGQCGPTDGSHELTAFPAAPPRPSRLRFFLRRRGRSVVVRVRVLRGEGRVLVRMQRADGRSAIRRGVSRRGDLWRYVFRLPGKGRWRAIIRFAPERGWTSAFIRARAFTVSE